MGVGRTLLAAVVVVFLGCGRLGFDPHGAVERTEDGGADAGTTILPDGRVLIPDAGPPIDAGARPPIVGVVTETVTGASPVTDVVPRDARVQALVWSGAEYGLAYELGSDRPRDVYLMRLSADGAVVGTPTQVSSGVDALRADVAWSGSHYGVVWLAVTAGATDVFFASVSADGALTVPPVAVTSSGFASNPSIEWNGSEFAVVFGDKRHAPTSRYAGFIWMTRVDTAGVRVASEAQITDVGCSGSPALAWTGSEYGVLYGTGSLCISQRVFQRVDDRGGAIGTDSVVSDAFLLGSGFAWTGSEFLSIDRGESGITAIPISALGAVGAARNIQTFAQSISAANLAFGGPTSAAGVTFEDAGQVQLVQWQTASSTPMATIVVSDTETAPRVIAAAAGEGRYGVAWTNDFAGRATLRFATVSP